MEPNPELAAARELIKRSWPGRPTCGIILGTGAGEVASQIQVESTIRYADIPGFPRATALGHQGQFVCGHLAGQPVIAMQGRFHLYEGYSGLQIRQPLALMNDLGVRTLLISNAAGGVNPQFASGDLMVLESHLDLMFHRWQSGPLPETPGRVAARADAYDRPLIDESIAFARKHQFVLHRGVYAGLTGPNYETRAEYRFLRRVGADVVGMSTIPEVVFAARLGMRILAFSIVANVANTDVPEATSGQDVIDSAARAAPRLGALVINAIEKQHAR